MWKYLVCLLCGLCGCGIQTVQLYHGDSVRAEKGAPWRQKKESDTVKPTEPYGYHHPSGPSDVEISAYCLLALHTVKKVDEGREILLWLQKQQNSNGGFSSTQVHWEIRTERLSLCLFLLAMLRESRPFQFGSHLKKIVFDVCVCMYVCFVLCLWGDWLCGLTWERICNNVLILLGKMTVLLLLF